MRFFRLTAKTWRRLASVTIVATGLLIASVVWLVRPMGTGAQFLVPFEGIPVYIEYNCLCSGSIMVTVQPTQATAQRGAQTVNLLFVWAADLLSNYVDMSMLPVPHAYLWCGVFWEGQQKLLGNYVPGGFPCYAFVYPSCVYRGTAHGAILNVGSSLF